MNMLATIVPKSDQLNSDDLIGGSFLASHLDRPLDRAALWHDLELRSGLDAEWRTATWAHEIGLYAQIHDSVPGLDSAYAGFLQTLAKANPEATTRIKGTLWQGTDHWDQLLDERAAMSGKLVLSEHTRKAIAAFKERR